MIDLLPFTAENVDTVPICQEEILLVVPDEVLKKPIPMGGMSFAKRWSRAPMYASLKTALCTFK